jgi:hypothetical protein
VRGNSQLASKAIKPVGRLAARDIEAAPQHAMLGSKDREVRQGVKLVAGGTYTGREACGYLAGPNLFTPAVT